MFNMFTKSIKILALIAFLVAAGVISIGIFSNLDKIKTLSSQQDKEQDSNAQKIAEKAIDYINENMLKGTTASLISVVEETGLYTFQLKIGDNEFTSYVTSDGKFLFPDPPVDLEQKISKEEPEQPEEKEYSLETLENLAKCLTEKGAKFYGSSGCGWCNRQKTLFGEASQYLPYVECADEKTKHLCEEAEIGPIPTWDFPDGQRVEGFQSIEKLAELSGCSL